MYLDLIERLQALEQETQPFLLWDKQQMPSISSIDLFFIFVPSINFLSLFCPFLLLSDDVFQ